MILVWYLLKIVNNLKENVWLRTRKKASILKQLKQQLPFEKKEIWWKFQWIRNRRDNKRA